MRVHLGEADQDGIPVRLLTGKDRSGAVNTIAGMRRSGRAVPMEQYVRLPKESGVPDSKSCT